MKNLLLGAIFIIASVVYIIQSQKLALGTLTKMGPAFFATHLSYFLLVLGLILVTKSFFNYQKVPLELNYKKILLTFFCIFIFVFFVDLLPFWILLITIFTTFVIGDKYVS